jgi:hypothetical protein
MSDRRAHAWATAIVAAGGLLAAAAAWWTGRANGEWRTLLIGLTAYVATGLLVARWGMEVYGWRGALGSVALTAFTPAVLGAAAAPALSAGGVATPMLATFAQLAAGYALMRCLLDPTAQWALVAGLTIAVAPVGAVEHAAVVLSGLAVFSIVLIACRAMTAERCEVRRRVARASAVAVGMAWLVALVLVLLIAAASDLPSAGEYTRRAPDSVGVMRIAAVESPAALPPYDGPSARAAWLASAPIAALLLAAVRPWRRQRRYTDAGWLAALLCLGVPAWFLADRGGACATPFAALLAGACWDASRSARARRAATVVAALQALAALLVWPRYPGAARPSAGLPTAHSVVRAETGS